MCKANDGDDHGNLLDARSISQDDISMFGDGLCPFLKKLNLNADVDAIICCVEITLELGDLVNITYPRSDEELKSPSLNRALNNIYMVKVSEHNGAYNKYIDTKTAFWAYFTSFQVQLS